MRTRDLHTRGFPGMWALIRFWNQKLARLKARQEKEAARQLELAAARERLRREQNERAFEKRWGRMF